MTHIETLVMNEVRKALENLSSQGVGYIDLEQMGVIHYNVDGRNIRVQVSDTTGGVIDMERTLDEAIAHEREEAKRIRKIIETGYDGEISIAEVFCDDTEAINEKYQILEKCAKEHEQRAEWLEELKAYRENSCHQCDYGECHEYHEKSLLDFFQPKKMRLETRRLMISKINYCIKLEI